MEETAKNRHFFTESLLIKGLISQSFDNQVQLKELISFAPPNKSFLPLLVCSTTRWKFCLLLFPCIKIAPTFQTQNLTFLQKLYIEYCFSKMPKLTFPLFAPRHRKCKNIENLKIGTV